MMFSLLKRSFTVVFGMFALVGLATTARAQTTILSNLAQTMTSNFTEAPGVSQYQAFKTDNHTYKVTNVTVKVRQSHSTDVFTVALFDYSPTNAFTLVGTVGTITRAGSSYTNVSLTPSSVITLDPTTSYWLGILNPNTNVANLDWASTTSSATTGVGSYQNNPTHARSFNAGSTFLGTNNVGSNGGAEMFSIQGTEVIPTSPEPMSAGLLLLGIPALGLVRRRQK